MAAAAAGAPGGSGAKRTYARAEIEALRGASPEDAQARLWTEAYVALAAAGFSGEYDGLFAAEESRNKRGNKGKNTTGSRRDATAAVPRFLDVADSAWSNGDLGVHHEHGLDAVLEPAGVYGAVEDQFVQGEDVEYEDDSDDDYEGILKPAFAVHGDPDFESGEPLDGFEYLRRVSLCPNE